MPVGEPSFNAFQNKRVEKPSIEKIAIADIEPIIPDDGGSVFILGSNDQESPDKYENIFDDIFTDLPNEEREKVQLRVIGADSDSSMAKEIASAAKASIKKFDLESKDQLMNKNGYVDLKSEKLSHDDEVEQIDIGTKVSDYMATLYHAIQSYHLVHPGKKVVVVLDMDSSVVEGMVNNKILPEDKRKEVKIQPGGGVIIEVGKDGEMKTIINDAEFPVSFSRLTSEEEILHKEQEFLERYLKAHPGEKITPEEMLAKLKREPLIRKEVEEVVDRFLENHIQHNYGQIIFVGSGSGKSFTVRNQNPGPDGKTDLVDADFVYRETGAHPLLDTDDDEPLRTFPWWYMGDDVILEVEKRCALVNQVMIEKGLWALTSSFDPEDPYLLTNHIIVELPWQEHLKNIHRKFSGDSKDFYDGGVRVTYDGLRIAKSHRKFVRDLIDKKGIEVVSSIPEAINVLKERENS